MNIPESKPLYIQVTVIYKVDRRLVILETNWKLDQFYAYLKSEEMYNINEEIYLVDVALRARITSIFSIKEGREYEVNLKELEKNQNV